METNYFTLASQYSNFLSALGGISITVLALVLALDRQPINKKAYPVLIVSLVLATFACFTGVHLMSETAALPRLTKAGTERSGLGPYLISTVNICIAPMLTGFSLMLLPKVYFKEKANRNDEDVIGIQWIANRVFFVVVGIAWFWTIYYFYARLNTPAWWWSWTIAIFLLSLSSPFIFRRFRFDANRQKRWARAFFIVLLVSIASPVPGFIFATDENPPPLWQAVIFYSAIMFSGASLLCLKAILLREDESEAEPQP